MTMNVIKPGTQVDLAEDVQGTVTDVMVSGESDIQYKVSWWNGRSRCHEWFQAFELDNAGCERASIGFHNGVSE